MTWTTNRFVPQPAGSDLQLQLLWPAADLSLKPNIGAPGSSRPPAELGLRHARALASRGEGRARCRLAEHAVQRVRSPANSADPKNWGARDWLQRAPAGAGMLDIPAPRWPRRRSNRELALGESCWTGYAR
jgi:hypothetical protein